MIIDAQAITLQIPVSVRHALSFFWQQGFSTTLIGGGTRDFLLQGKLPSDLDFEIHGKDSKWIESLPLWEKHFSNLRPTLLPFGILRLQWNENTVAEFSPAREEIYKENDYTHTNFYANIDPSLSFEKSFLRRDFTINAIGLQIQETQAQWIDPLHGKADLQKKILRPCSENFMRDPVRFLRAIRFELNLDFIPSLELVDQVRRCSLEGLSSYYFFSEAFKTKKTFKYFSIFFNKVKEFQIALPPFCEQLSFLGSFPELDKHCEDSEQLFQALVTEIPHQEVKLKNLAQTIGFSQKKLKQLLRTKI